jgi:hypothetical protein
VLVAVVAHGGEGAVHFAKAHHSLGRQRAEFGR